MAWKLSEGGFQLVPEGTHIFKITDYKWDEDFGKLEFTLETANGYKHIERFGLLDADGEVNEKANNLPQSVTVVTVRNPWVCLSKLVFTNGLLTKVVATLLLSIKLIVPLQVFRSPHQA